MKTSLKKEQTRKCHVNNNNHNNNLTCKAPVCAKKTSVALFIENTAL